MMFYVYFLTCVFLKSLKFKTALRLWGYIVFITNAIFLGFSQSMVHG